MTAYNDERAVLLAQQIANYQNEKFKNNASIVSISTEDNFGTRIIDLKKYDYLAEENKEK